MYLQINKLHKNLIRNRALVVLRTLTWRFSRANLSALGASGSASLPCCGRLLLDMPTSGEVKIDGIQSADRDLIGAYKASTTRSTPG